MSIPHDNIFGPRERPPILPNIHDLSVLDKDEFETHEEYRQRLEHICAKPFIIGEVSLDKQNYNADSQVFTVNFKPCDWLKGKLSRAVETDFYIKVSPSQAKALYSEYERRLMQADIRVNEAGIQINPNKGNLKLAIISLNVVAFVPATGESVAYSCGQHSDDGAWCLLIIKYDGFKLFKRFSFKENTPQPDFNINRISVEIKAALSEYLQANDLLRKKRCEVEKMLDHVPVLESEAIHEFQAWKAMQDQREQALAEAKAEQERAKWERVERKYHIQDELKRAFKKLHIKFALNFIFGGSALSLLYFYSGFSKNPRMVEPAVIISTSLALVFLLIELRIFFKIFKDYLWLIKNDLVKVDDFSQLKKDMLTIAICFDALIPIAITLFCYVALRDELYYFELSKALKSEFLMVVTGFLICISRPLIKAAADPKKAERDRIYKKLDFMIILNFFAGVTIYSLLYSSHPELDALRRVDYVYVAFALIEVGINLWVFYSLYKRLFLLKKCSENGESRSSFKKINLLYIMQVICFVYAASQAKEVNFSEFSKALELEIELALFTFLFILA